MSLNLDADFLGTLVGILLTLAIFSYVWADNFLFRLAIHIFIGAAAGYAAVVAARNVLWPQLLLPMITGSSSQQLYLAFPLLLGLLLLTKLSRRLAGWGNFSMTFLVGVGVATAIGGAVMGTIFPQVFNGTIGYFDPAVSNQSGIPGIWHLFNGLVILVGTLSALIYFHYGKRAQTESSVRRFQFLDLSAGLGQIFIAITFGTLFAGIYAAALVALIERLQVLIMFIFKLLGLN